MRSSGVLRIRRCLRWQRGCSALSAAVVLVIGLVVALPASAPAVSFTFNTIDVPGAFFTKAHGIVAPSSRTESRRKLRLNNAAVAEGVEPHGMG